MNIFPGDFYVANRQITLWARPPSNALHKQIALLITDDLFFVVCNVVVLEKIRTAMVMTTYGLGWIDIKLDNCYRKYIE